MDIDRIDRREPPLPAVIPQGDGAPLPDSPSIIEFSEDYAASTEDANPNHRVGVDQRLSARFDEWMATTGAQIGAEWVEEGNRHGVFEFNLPSTVDARTLIPHRRIWAQRAFIVSEPTA